MTNLCCMSFIGKDQSEILVAGCQNIMYRIDVERGQVIQEVLSPKILEDHQLTDS